jgi:hypothetical protein
MDQVSAGEATHDVARNRRRRMRDRARSQQHPVHAPVPDRYQTPEWLERSFVLPLTQPEASDVPSQSVPHHDDDPLSFVEPSAIREDVSTDHLSPGSFVRPPSDDIDFARVVRRSDLCRTAERVAWATAGMAGLTLIAYLLTGSVVVLALDIVFALACITALAARTRLAHAPIPRLQR